jgi:hypothetical protein
MVRYLLAVAGVVAVISGPALAEDMGGMGGTTKVITRSHDGMGGKKVIIKRHADGVVSKKIIRRDRMFGSSTPERRVIREREIVR